MLVSAEVILPVRDVPASIRFYRDVVGFERDWVWGDDSSFGGVTWGSVQIMFQRTPDGPFGTSLYCGVREVDALYERHLMAGVVATPIGDKPWGRREYTVRDPDGHSLRIGSRTESAARASNPLPPEVQFEDRIVTADEFNDLRRAVGWGDSRNAADILGNTWDGVTATVEGIVIATVRITMDSEGWFGVWDMVVAPNWQGRRIGESLMNRAIERVREVSPGAFVFLFTFQDDFYTKLGFRTMDAMSRNV